MATDRHEGPLTDMIVSAWEASPWKPGASGFEPERERRAEPERERRAEPEHERRAEPECERRAEPECERRAGSERERRVEPECERRVEPSYAYMRVLSGFCALPRRSPAVAHCAGGIGGAAAPPLLWLFAPRRSTEKPGWTGGNSGVSWAEPGQRGVGVEVRRQGERGPLHRSLLVSRPTHYQLEPLPSLPPLPPLRLPLLPNGIQACFSFSLVPNKKKVDLFTSEKEENSLVRWSSQDSQRKMGFPLEPGSFRGSFPSATGRLSLPLLP
ncbi:uncharacterized protein LOC118217181 [Anguilla anguilla]|uniref:uncharacterized protein LOC118217181 n=1 Tax=Anguilla anguilla TaxID=7936 RepID=UPI0015A7CFDB|nr:uncharacterized protein LOC118217181 [Anguilla anguilla]